MRRTVPIRPIYRVLSLLLAFNLAMPAQSGPTTSPQQAPKTAPQVERILPAYEGQNVTSVELAGQPDIDPLAFDNVLLQHANSPFNRAKVEQTLSALKDSGKFQSVELEVRPDPEGVRVLYVLHPAMFFGVYQFPGAENKFAYSRLVQVADYPPRGAYTPVDVANARRMLETFFKRNGFFQAVVTPELDVDRAHGLVNVRFRTDLKKKAKFGNLDLKGTTPEESQMLESKLHSIMARLKNSAIRSGKSYNSKTLQNAAQYLNGQLSKQGFLGAQVKLVGAAYDPETNRADISFNINTGPKVSVKVEGGHLWPWTRKKLLPVYQQAGVNPEIIQEGRQNLISHWESKGYFDAKVTVDTQKTSPNGETIVYKIEKGPRHKVAGVEVAGNQKLSDKELMAHVPVQKGHFFYHGNYSEKLVRKSVKNLKNLYAANGFSSVKITPEVTKKDENIIVRFRVDEGPQDIVEALKVAGNDSQPITTLVPKGLNLAPGQPYSQKKADEDRNAIMAKYLDMGYLNATFRETAVPVNKDPHRLAVTYQIQEGPQVRIAEVATIGKKVTYQPLINRTIATLRPETPMREGDLLKSETELYNLGVFDWAEIDPRRTITTQTQEDVIVKVHEAKRNTITYGGGFEVINRGGSLPSGTVAVPGLPLLGISKKFKTSERTFYGPRGNFEYTRKNIRGRGETFTIAGLGGRLDQRGSINYLDPYFRGTNWASTFTVSGEHNSQNPIFTSRLAQFSWQLQRPLNKDKTTNMFLRYSFRETGLTRLLIPELIPAADRHVRLSILSGNFIRDTRDNPLDATKGIYQSYEAGINPGVIGSNFSFAKFLAQTAYYHKVFADIVWANNVRLGILQPFAGSHIPVEERFFSGGGSTLRGFPLNGAGPQQQISVRDSTGTLFPITVPVGGNQLFIVNSEFRIPVNYDLPFVHKNLGFAAFYDGGNVFMKPGFSGQYTNTFGFGIRYKTPVGPVRVDVGHNLNAPPGVKSTQFFVTLGQAF